jgi:polyhydroxybutyrate depolymerase
MAKRVRAILIVACCLVTACVDNRRLRMEAGDELPSTTPEQEGKPNVGQVLSASEGSNEKSCAIDPGVYEKTLAHDGHTRQYLLYRPEGLVDIAPVVFLLHGLTGTAAGMMQSKGMNTIADEHGFAVVYPQGLKLKDVLSGHGDSAETTFWGTDPSYELDLDDVDFLSKLAAEVQTGCNLDKHRTFIAGHSAGGSMSYSMACYAPQVFRAVGVSAGREPPNCEPSLPTPVVHIHGVDDRAVPHKGIDNKEDSKRIPAVEETVKRWATINGFDTVEKDFLPPKTTTYRYKNSQDSNEVWYYEIADWGHGWSTPDRNTGTDTSRVIWEFFSRY